MRCFGAGVPSYFTGRGYFAGRGSLGAFPWFVPPTLWWVHCNTHSFIHARRGLLILSCLCSASCCLRAFRNGSRVVYALHRTASLLACLSHCTSSLLLHSSPHSTSYITATHIHIKRSPACDVGSRTFHLPELIARLRFAHACSRRHVLPLTSRRSVRRWVSVAAASIAFSSTHRIVV